jgi:hypothetical protein
MNKMLGKLRNPIEEGQKAKMDFFSERMGTA